MRPTGFESITIEGFKSIRSIKDQTLRPINLLIGANGSGKSNFLDAFVFLGEAGAGNIPSFVTKSGGAEKLLHFGSKKTKEIIVDAYECNGFTSIAHYFYVEGDQLAGMVTRGGLAANGQSFNRFRFHDTGEDSPLKKTNSIDDNRWLRRLGGNLAAFLYRLSKTHPDSYQAIRKTVQQVAPFFEDFQLAPQALNPNSIKLEWRHKNSDEYWDASSFSDGTLRFIALATLFLQPVELRPSVILIDEPELGLHPVAITLLASLIRQASVNTQVIAATQSPRLVDCFEPEDILVANREQGATTIDRLDPDRLTEWLEEYSLGELWEKAEFAGRPMRE